MGETDSEDDMELDVNGNVFFGWSGVEEGEKGAAAVEEDVIMMECGETDEFSVNVGLCGCENECQCGLAMRAEGDLMKEEEVEDMMEEETEIIEIREDEEKSCGKKSGKKMWGKIRKKKKKKKK